jgi:hypothetical protein
MMPDERSHLAVEVAELFADGLATGDELREAFEHAQEAALRWYYGAPGVPNSCGLASALPVDVTFPGDPATAIAEQAAAAAAEAEREDAAPHDAEQASEWVLAAETAEQANIFRDVFGNPFRPVAFDPAWRTTDVLLLARGIYEERAFDRMPILADALQDAGCDSDDLLGHLRDATATHVRGCWALDLVLGKE